MDREDFHPEVWAQYEDVRRSGRCNMVNTACVRRVAMEMGHARLARVAKDPDRYSQLLRLYDSDHASGAHRDFDFTGGGL